MRFVTSYLPTVITTPRRPTTDQEWEAIHAEQREFEAKDAAAMAELYMAAQETAAKKKNPPPATPLLLDDETPEHGFSGAPMPCRASYAGVALPFSTWSNIHTIRHSSLGESGVPGLSFVHPGSFRDCLQAIMSGDWNVGIRIEHGQDDTPTPTFSTADGSLRFWPRTDALWFTLHVPDRRDLRDLERLRMQFPCVSLGARPVVADCRRTEDGGTVLLEVTAAVIDELSVCVQPAFSGTHWLPTGSHD